MVIDADKVKHIATLARIRVTEEEVVSYAQELSSIMGLIEELNEVVDSDVHAVASIVTHPLPMREDIVTDGFMVEAVLANAPASSYGCFVVPKVIDQG